MNAELTAIVNELERRARAWKPFPGPQTMALESQADILFYGGAAGGGKTDLLLGAARYHHKRAIIFRRVSPSLSALIDRSREIYTADGKATMDNFTVQPPRWKFDDGASIRFGSVQYEKDVTDYQGNPHDCYGFDEITEFSEAQFRFLIGWNRTTIPGQRCRVICTGNPPTSSDGAWVIKFFAPWLDDTHPNPAQPGELRWFTTINGKDVECPGPEPVEVDGEWIQPKSRTFIPARVQDNPKLMASGYIAQLQALPEPLRSKMLYGDFKAGAEDNAYQVIPTAWVDAAMDRWSKREEPSTPADALGVDVARGGKDATCFATRKGNWFGRVVSVPGVQTPDGQSVAALAVLHAKNNCMVTVDIVGVGSSAFDFLSSSGNIRVRPFNGAEKAIGSDKSGQLEFVNRRAEAYWKMREMLDPSSGMDVCLPVDPELKADLCAPLWKMTARGVQIESKEDLAKRIGRSPDKGDAVIMAALMVPPVLMEEELAYSPRGLSWMS